MLRLARLYVPSGAVAEEVVQETWLAVVRGIDRYEGRGPLRAWVFGILLNRARTAGPRERRSLPFASWRRDDEPAVDPALFQGRRGERPGWWVVPPSPVAAPDERLEASETRAALVSAIRALPPRQRQVLELRDVVGMGPEEACEVMGVSDGNHRVLLHRARSRLRAALERHLTGRDPA